MGKTYIKINYNRWFEMLDDLIGRQDQASEPIQREAFAVATGAEILSTHLRRIAKHAIDTEDKELMRICMDMGIVQETPEEAPENEPNEEGKME